MAYRDTGSSSPGPDSTTHAKPARRGDIQGLRALAVLAVVLYHADAGLSGGFVGVDMFFVISGFVITRLLVWEMRSEGRVDLPRFYVRRVRRLLPALVTLLSFVFVISQLLGPISGRSNSLRTGLWALLINANNDLAGVLGSDPNDYFTPFSELDSFLHTWSLSVEEQFYLVFPLLLAATWRLAVGRSGGDRAERLVVAVLGIVTIASFALSLFLMRVDPDLAFYLSPSRAWEFSVGALLVLVPHGRLATSAASRLAVAGVGAVLTLWAVLVFDDLTAFPGTAALVPVIGTAALIAAGEHGSNPVSAFLAVRPLQWIGDLSYSWYLWHWPFIVLAGALWPDAGAAKPLAAVVSLAPALLSLRMIENRFRFAANPGPALRFGLVCLLVPAGAALVGGELNSAADETPALAEFDRVFAPHVDAEHGCAEDAYLGERDRPECTWQVPNSRGDVVLIGDSTAAHYDKGVIAGFNQEGYTVTVATRGSCPFADMQVFTRGRTDPTCREFVDRSTSTLLADPPAVVIVAMSNSVYLTSDEFTLAADEGASPVAGEDDKAAILEQALATTLAELRSSGSEVILLHTTPPFDGWFPGSCAFVVWRTDRGACADSQPRMDAEAFRAAAIRAETAAATRAGATAVDLFGEICPGSECRTLEDWGWRYLDGVHITVAQSARLAPTFAALAP